MSKPKKNTKPRAKRAKKMDDSAEYPKTTNGESYIVPHPTEAGAYIEVPVVRTDGN